MGGSLFDEGVMGLVAGGVVNPSVKADDPFFHWRWGDGESFCGLRGKPMRLSTALGRGLSECFDCRRVARRMSGARSG